MANKQIIVSEDLKNILKEIESESVVARLLLQGEVDEDMLVEKPINYISIAHDKTRISYLTIDRIARMTESEYWEASKRFSVRPGAFVAKVFKNISSRDVEVFSNLYRSCISNGNLTFKVVSGEDIQKYYHYSKYQSLDDGTLGASCMKHNYCKYFFGIYCENTTTVKMLVAVDEDDRLIGRALLWEFDGNKIMDRIYSVRDEEYKFKFKKWATENGYLYKSEQNWYNTLNFENLKTEKREIKFDIKLDKFNFEKYPYLDTFKFIDFNTGVISNYIPEGNHKILCSAEGHILDRGYLRFDDIDRVLRHGGDCVYVRYLDIHTCTSNVNYSDINDDYILCKDSVYNSEFGDYLFNEEYDKYNNIKRIEERKAWIQKRNEERERRRQEKEKERAEARLTIDTAADVPLNFTSDWNEVLNFPIDIANFYRAAIGININPISLTEDPTPTEE